MTARMPILAKAVAIFLCTALMVACSTHEAALPEPTHAANSRPTTEPTPSQAVPHPVTAAAPRSEIKLTILHTNDSRGYVDPCG